METITKTIIIAGGLIITGALTIAAIIAAFFKSFNENFDEKFFDDEEML